MADRNNVQLTNRQIRVLAHPLRIRLLARLRGEGPATATKLAEMLSTNTGATSYHLRQLAEVGLVVEEERPGSGRQRWWRAAHDMSSWRRSDYTEDPDASAAAVWLETFQVNRFVEVAEMWQHGVRREPEEWQDAGGVSDYVLTLTAGQMRELVDELEEVVERYVHRDPSPGARRVNVYLAAVPQSHSEAGVS